MYVFIKAAFSIWHMNLGSNFNYASLNCWSRDHKQKDVNQFEYKYLKKEYF